MMYCYFSSVFPAAIKLNGVYFGRCDGDARGIDLDGDVFVEVCPLNLGPSSGFLLDKNFLLSPPKPASVTDLKGGYLIRINSEIASSEFKIIEQKKYPYAVITVFREGGLKASLETPQGLISDCFSFDGDTAEIYDVKISGRDVGVIFFPDKGAAYLYDLTETPEKLGEILADKISTENGFTTNLFKKDMAKHRITSTWEIKDGKLSEYDKTVVSSENFDRTALPEKLIPYAFLEEVSVDGDYGFFLSETVKKNADKLKSYLGEFLAVMPPPFFRKNNEVGLIYKISDNKYSVDYITVDITDGKITNLKRSET